MAYTSKSGIVYHTVVIGPEQITVTAGIWEDYLTRVNPSLVWLMPIVATVGDTDDVFDLYDIKMAAPFKERQP